MDLADFQQPKFLPFVVVIFGGQEVPDKDLARLFELKKNPRRPWKPDTRSPSTEVAIAEGDSWKAIGDWHYSLWHDPRTRPAIWKLARQFRLLAFALGDTDSSYSIHHFERGGLTRELVVGDRFGGGAQEVLIDTGERLSGETDKICGEADLYSCVRDIALATGFDPSEAYRTTSWHTTDSRTRFDQAQEQALLNTSWENYR